jgi:hypothetical protein
MPRPARGEPLQRVLGEHRHIFPPFAQCVVRGDVSWLPMDVSASPLLAHLQSTAFRDIAGSRVSARIPVSRSLVNMLVAHALEGATSSVRNVDVRPHEGDRFDVLVTLSWPFVPPLTVVATVEQQPQFPASPVLVLRWSLLGVVGALASRVIASLDRLPAGIRLDGDRLALDIPALAARGPAATLLPYVKALELHTFDDHVVLDVELEIR